LLPVVEIEGLKLKGGKTICEALAQELRGYISIYLSRQKQLNSQKRPVAV